MTTTTPTAAPPGPDYTAITARQRDVWASGDYSAIAARIPLISERLCDAADLRAGDRVLDVAGGSGNTAIAAARCGAEVTSLDYVPALQARGAARAAAEGLEVTWVEGDAQAMPFADASFDAVVSGVGVMFAPDQRRAAAELLRVCRTGGTIALANWTPDGFIGELLRTVGRHVAPPPGVAPPTLWGDEAHVRDLLGDGVTELRARTRAFRFRHRTPQEFVEFFRALYGPVRAAFGRLDAPEAARMADEIAELVTRFDRHRDGGPVAAEGDYLEIVAVRA